MLYKTIFTELDCKLAYIGIFIGTLLLFISLKISIGIGLSLVIVSSSLLYVYLSKKTEYLHNMRYSQYKSKFYLTVLFFILASALFLIHYFKGSFPRNISFFIFLSFISAIIGIEIYSLENDKYAKIILFQILLFSLCIILSGILVYPHIGSDQLFHCSFMRQLIEKSHISHESIYGSFPLMHIGLAIVSMVTNILDEQLLLVFYVAIPYIILLVIPYLIGIRIFDVKKSLFSVLFLSFNIWYIFWGIFSVPMTYSFSIFLIYLYTLCKKTDGHSLLYLVISLTFIATIILSHPVGSLSFAIFLSIIFLVQKAQKTLKLSSSSDLYFITFSYIILFIVMLIGYWIYSANTFFENQIRTLLVEADSTSGFLTLKTQKSVLSYEFSYLSLYIIYIFYSFGIFRWVQSDLRNTLKNIINTSSIVYLFIGYFSWVIGVTTIIPHRWLFYASLFLVFPASDGFIWTLNKINNLNKRNIIIFSIIFLITFISINSIIVNVDAPLLGKSDAIRLQLKDSEVCAASFITNHYKGFIYSDFLHWQYFHYLNSSCSKNLVLSNDELENPYKNNKAFVIRKYVYTYPVQRPTYRLNDKLLKTNNENMRRVYDDGAVNILINR